MSIVQYPMELVSLTAGFGLYTVKGATAMHYGIDLVRQGNTTVVATHSGRVVGAFYHAMLGNTIALQGPFNDACDIVTQYGHLYSRKVSLGKSVSAGQAIGIQGNTGSASTGQHLHFETWLVPRGYSYSYSDKSKYAVDPLSVCHVLNGQSFVNDKYTRYMDGIPYPEPGIALAAQKDSKVVVSETGPEFFYYPSNVFAPIVGGNNRGKRYITDFFSAREFSAKYLCENNGFKWAGVSSDYGLLWVPLIAGRSALIGAAG